MPPVSPALFGYAHLHHVQGTPKMIAQPKIHCQEPEVIAFVLVLPEISRRRPLACAEQAHQNQLVMAWCWPSAPAPALFM